MPLQLKITVYNYGEYNELGYLNRLKTTDCHPQHEKIHIGL
jgi:hypothetical protein